MWKPSWIIFLVILLASQIDHVISVNSFDQMEEILVDIPHQVNYHDCTLMCDQDQTYKDRKNLNTRQLLDMDLAGTSKKVETVVVTTKSGHQLTLYHVKGPLCSILFHHGALSFHRDWLLYPNNIVILLILAGWDVWLLGMRGVEGSLGHVKYDPNKDWQYWNYSSDEIIEDDMPLVVDTIISTINGPCHRLFYVGYSIGGLIGAGLVSLRPEYNDKFIFIFIAPAIFLAHAPTPLHALAFIYLTIPPLSLGLNHGELLPALLLPYVHNILADYCGPTTPLTSLLCVIALSAVTGVNGCQTNPAIIEVGGTYFPQRFSAIQLNQLMQYMAGKYDFCKTDYGIAMNILCYGSIRPPKYQLDNVKAPTVILYSDNDSLVSSRDVENAAKGMGGKPFMVKLSWLNHFDYVMGKCLPQLWDLIFQILSKLCYKCLISGS